MRTFHNAIAHSLVLPLFLDLSSLLACLQDTKQSLTLRLFHLLFPLPRSLLFLMAL